MTQQILKALKNKLVAITNQTSTIKGQIDNTKRDFVAILGIFAAIFMAFDSGLKINLAIFDKKWLDGLIALYLIHVRIVFHSHFVTLSLSFCKRYCKQQSKFQ